MLVLILSVLVVLALGLAAFLYVKYRLALREAKGKVVFFTDIAHDIRTPVSLIKAPLSELEAQEVLSEHGRKLLSIALKNADKLSALATQWLDLQKVGTNMDALLLSKQNIYDYMYEKSVGFRMLAEQKGIALRLEIRPDFPPIYFDKHKMDKILDNLLSNAIKYTERGTVSVRLAHSKDDWSICIEDTGIGIPENEQKRLFKRFYRAVNAINSSEGGSGIGLTLTRKLVHLLHGSISFSSAEGKGSTFLLLFPLIKQLPQTGHEKGEWNAQSAETTYVSTGKEILLLAEDDKEMNEYLTQSLSGDYHVISLSDGAKVPDLAKEVNPDIIISDILMPGLRGDEACRILKSSMETSHIPFILLSALSEKENIIMGLEAGANDYIVKPFDFNILKARIRNILQSRERLRRTLLSAESSPEEIEYTNRLDKQFLDKATRIIEAEMGNSEFSINEFCRMLGMSRTSVYNKIKTLTDQAPNDFIRIIRLNKARELLKSKQYSITEVSGMIGFSDPKYFSTSFKKHFGINPGKAY